MATYSDSRRMPLDLPAATRRCAEATRALGHGVQLEVENEAFGLVVATRGQAKEDPSKPAERFRWELWPVEPGVTEAKLHIETEGATFFARGHLKETADWLLDAAGRGA